MGRHKNKKGTRRKRTPETQSRKPHPLVTPQKAILKKIPKAIWWMIGLFALAVTLLEGYPWLSIQEASFLDPQDPYSEMFKVINGGYIPITDLTATCLSSANIGRTRISGAKSTFDNFADYLAHDGAVTVPCFRALRAENIKVAEGATLQVEITYALYHLNHPSLRRTQTFRFKSIVGTGGSQHWLFLP